MPTSPTKVLLLIKSLGLGGAERLLVDSLPYLDRDRFDYHLAYLVPWKDALVPHFLAAGLPVHCLGARNGVERSNVPTFQRSTPFTPARPLQAAALLPLAYGRLLALQRREGFGLIHADLPVAGLLARAVGRRCCVPVVYTEHNLVERYHPFTRWANRLTYGWNSHVLAVSDEVAASIRRSGMDAAVPVTALPNGVPMEQIRAEAGDLDGLCQELGLPNGAPVVGTVAVFRRQKRLLDWLAVAGQVAQTRPDVHFLLVGDGPDMPAVRAQAAALGLGDRLHLPGFRDDGRSCLALMDVYLMTSEFEGLPIALLEAMALAKPVVATAVGGVPQAVIDGETGYLLAVGDNGTASARVLALLADAPLRARMGEAAVQRIASGFHTRDRVAAIEAIYSETLQGRPCPPPDDVAIAE